MKMSHNPISTSVACGVILAALAAGCEPSKPKQISPTTPPIETRKTIGQTTQNIMPLADALKQGGQMAEMSITGGGLDAITSDAYRTSVGKIGIMQQRFQNLQQLATLWLGKFLGSGRHFLFANSIKDMSPLSSLLRVVQIRSGTRQIEPTFFCLRVVAFAALRFDDFDDRGEIISEAGTGAGAGG